MPRVSLSAVARRFSAVVRAPRGGDGRARAQVKRVDPDALHPQEERPLEVGPPRREALPGRADVAGVEGGFDLAQQLVPVLQEEPAGRPAGDRLLQLFPRLPRLVLREAHEIGETRPHVRRGEEVAAVLGLAEQPGKRVLEFLELAEVSRESRE